MFGGYTQTGSVEADICEFVALSATSLTIMSHSERCIT